MTLNRRQTAEIFGRKMERRAAFWCRFLGHHLVASRVKTPVGEVDLITKKGDGYIFTEVKARRQPDQYDAALEAIQIDRIQQAALYWISTQNMSLDTNMRFDALIFVPRLKLFGVYFCYWPTHLKNLTQ